MTRIIIFIFVTKFCNKRETPATNNSSSPSNSEGGIGGTKKPQATGIDKEFPDDCGRDAEKGTGLLCFPDGKLCADSKNDFPSAKFSFLLF